MSSSTFLKGFNHGFVLSANKPSLIIEYKDILDSKSDYSEGFRWGIAKQRNLEVKNNPSKDQSKNRDDDMTI